MAWLPWENYRDSLIHTAQVYMNIHYSTAAWRKFNAPHIVSRWELIPCLWKKRWASFHKNLKWSFPSSIGRWEGLCAFCLKWNVPREAWLKEGQISLLWLKFRLVFHVTRWRDVWIPCGDPRESRRSPPHQDRGNQITLTPREAHGIQCLKRWRCLTLLENG